MRRWLAGIAEDADDLPTERLERRTRSMATAGRWLTRLKLAKLASRDKFGPRVSTWLSGYDALLTATIAEPPVPIGHWHGKGWFGHHWALATGSSPRPGTSPVCRRCRCRPASPTTGCRSPCSSSLRPVVRRPCSRYWLSSRTCFPGNAGRLRYDRRRTQGALKIGGPPVARPSVGWSPACREPRAGRLAPSLCGSHHAGSVALVTCP